MASARVSRAAVSLGFDMAVFVLGVGVALPAVGMWLREGGQLDALALVWIALVVVMSRFPLMLTHKSGDIELGFETCILVFLVLTEPPLTAFSIWAIATTIAMATQRKSWRSRTFNIGLTLLGAALFVWVVTLIDPGGDQLAALVAIMVACAIYFAFDMLVTACSLALEDGVPLSSVLRWGSVPLGLACFVSVDTLGYLGWLLNDTRWTLALLLVPVATILVAVRSVSETRLAQLRLMGLLEAATHAPDWSDEGQIEKSLVVQAERTLRHTTASLREEPAEPHEIGAPIEVEGRPTRHLVVGSQLSGRGFDEHDRKALEALTAVGVSAFNRRRLSDEMVYLARHDALTGLHNRGVFTDRLVQALHERGSHGMVAVLYCDLDGFKEVNDLLGHDAGDRLLVLVAERVMTCLREGDTAARLGGDEFGVLLDDITDEGQAEAVAQRLLEALEVPFVTADQQVRVRVSIGIAFSGTEPTTAELLINCADTAMYAAKARGKGCVERFHPHMRAAELDRLELEAALRDAVREDRIRVHYQPIVDLGTGRVDGFEALARWNHPTLGSVRPDVFIAAAERIGLIRQLGIQILERAHLGGRMLADAAGEPISLGVNLSALQVTDSELHDRVTAKHREHEQVRLVLELTEGMLLGDDPSTLASLHSLRGSGVRLAIDDFGVGYSSVGYLHRLPVDILKLDKLFVSELHDPRSHALVQGVVAMARAMDLSVITEGVEDWHSAVSVRDLGCDLAQGYVFSRPLHLGGALRVAEAGHVDVSGMAAVAVPVASGR